MQTLLLRFVLKAFNCWDESNGETNYWQFYDLAI